MMTSKKSGFWTFLFSLLPGAGEMYLGFLKQGASIMIAFWGVFALISGFNLNFLIFLLPVLWIYSFFHTHNLRALPDEEFYTIEDRILFFDTCDEYSCQNMKDFFQRHKTATAWVLILLGISLLWNSLLDFLGWFLPNALYNVLNSFSYNLPQIFIAVAIIAFGLYLISGKKDQLNKEQDYGQEKNPDLNIDFPFSQDADFEQTNPLIPSKSQDVSDENNHTEAPTGEPEEKDSTQPQSKELAEDDKNL